MMALKNQGGAYGQTPHGQSRYVKVRQQAHGNMGGKRQSMPSTDVGLAPAYLDTPNTMIVPQLHRASPEVSRNTPHIRGTTYMPLLKSGTTGQNPKSYMGRAIDGSIESLHQKQVGHSSSVAASVAATMTSRKRLCVPKHVPASKFSDREKDFYRYNVFYNRMAEQVKADPVLLPQSESKGILQRSK